MKVAMVQRGASAKAVGLCLCLLYATRVVQCAPHHRGGAGNVSLTFGYTLHVGKSCQAGDVFRSISLDFPRFPFCLLVHSVGSRCHPQMGFAVTSWLQSDIIPSMA